MYDTDGDGKIVYEEVFELYEAILSILGEDIDCENSHKFRVDRLFDVYDSVRINFAICKQNLRMTTGNLQKMSFFWDLYKTN